MKKAFLAGVVATLLTGAAAAQEKSVVIAADLLDGDGLKGWKE